MKPINQQQYYQFKILTSFIMMIISIISSVVTFLITAISYIIFDIVTYESFIVLSYFIFLSTTFKFLKDRFTKKEKTLL